MGWLRPGFQACVADEDDAALPPGEAGELLLRADEPYAFASGYFNMPEKTVEAWRNLWFHTGDRVVRDADGAFRFVDRIKDAIRRRGENISSFEVEQVLLSHAAVASCAVYPVRSELAEDEVMAALVACEGAHIDPVELARFCERALALLRGAALHRRAARPAAHRERQGAEVQAARARRGAADLGWPAREAFMTGAALDLEAAVSCSDSPGHRTSLK
jgi:crotonobetaine/carnitine-CoA ligase